MKKSYLNRLDTIKDRTQCRQKQWERTSRNRLAEIQCTYHRSPREEWRKLVTSELEKDVSLRLNLHLQN